MRWLLILLLLLGAGARAPARAYASTATAADSAAERTPRGALLRALVLPGWGQFYNQQYLKVPLVYLGFAGFAAGVAYNHDQLLLYRQAARFRQWDEDIADGELEPETDPAWQQFEGSFLEVVDRFGGQQPRSSFLRARRDNFRRNRDLFILGVGLWYGLTILDAYVSAHLRDFDVGEDLSVDVVPHPDGVTATLRLGF